MHNQEQPGNKTISLSSPLVSTEQQAQGAVPLASVIYCTQATTALRKCRQQVHAVFPLRTQHLFPSASLSTQCYDREHKNNK